ncbi:MAG TPA: hypothetical protein VF261_00620, partial [Candidatus Saccharimonadales bacterium]
DFEKRGCEDPASLGSEGQFEWWGTELPPKEYWLVNPYENPIVAPTDERNVVNPRQVLELGRGSVGAGYAWLTNMTRDDHSHWPESAYKAAAHKLDSLLPIVFRDLPPNKVRWPWGFERWKHRLMIPSDFPDLETMHMSVEAWHSAESLFESIIEATRLEKLRRNRRDSLRTGTGRARPRFADDREAEGYFVEALADKSKGVALGLERHVRIPAAYRFIEPGDTVRDVARKLSFMKKYGCRDGITGRQLHFPQVIGERPAPAVKKNIQVA